MAQIIKLPKMAPFHLVRLLHDRIGGKLFYRGGHHVIVKVGEK